MAAEPLTEFSPAARAWFEHSFPSPTPAQVGAWAAISAGDSALVIAPTGSGKTLAAFFAALDRLAHRADVDAAGPRGTTVVYVSPLKALAVDIERNLRAPLVGIAREAARLGAPVPDITIGVRTGDTPASERRRMVRHPPDILITTPESLYLMLTSATRDILRTTETVIVDEIHAVVGTKRGSHLSLSLERLEALLERPAQRVGLSATVRPADTVAAYLGGARPVHIVDEPGDKHIDIQVSVPVDDMSAVGLAPADRSDPTSVSIWPALEQRIAEVVRRRSSTLVFVNSRRIAERLTSRLNEIAADNGWQPEVDGVPQPLARAHHGSVSREQRAQVEDDLKAGRLPAVVATSSLELGIDMGAIDLVVQVEAPPTIAAGLQRIGRAGHSVGAVSHGLIYPKFRGDLVQSAAVAEKLRDRGIEAVSMPAHPLDVLAQQVVAAVAMDDWHIDELATLVRRAAPYRDLPESAWVAVVDMVAGKYPSASFSELRARILWDRTSGILSARPSSQRLAVTSGGTIPDRGLFGVHMTSADGTRVGELDEEMVYESRVGDVFTLGAGTWRIEDITHDRVLVAPAPGQPAKAPFWHGDTPGRSAELGAHVGAFVRAAAGDPGAAQVRLTAAGLDQQASRNLLQYLADQRAATGVVPDDRTLVLERCRDELGDWQVILHSPYGGRVHAPWALLVADRVRASTGLDIQVLHSDDGIVLRIPDTEDDQLLDEVTSALLVDPAEVESGVARCVTGSALFASRFRECAARALLLPRRDPGRRTPLWRQRQRGAQLLSVASEFPDFPVALEALRECLLDVYDVAALRTLLADLSSGAVRLLHVDTAQPSPFATSLLFGYVAAFMYEGDAPLAERRAQALTLDPQLVRELLGGDELSDLLDPVAVAEVSAEVSWLTAQRALRGPEDLADALRTLGPLSPEGVLARGAKAEWIDALVDARRAIRVDIAGPRVAAIEDAGLLLHALGTAMPPGVPVAFTEPLDDPLGQLLARYARTRGPFSTADAAGHWGLGPAVAHEALEHLRSRDAVVAGTFGDGGPQWCDAQVLRRIRRRTVAHLRSQTEPVTAVAYADFLPQWQGVGSDDRGVDATFRAVELLAGVPLPASALERHILPARVTDYRPEYLDELTAAGDVVWVGAGAAGAGDGWVSLAPADLTEALPAPDEATHPLASAVLTALGATGALFATQLREAVEVPDDHTVSLVDLDDALIALMWAGQVTNDSFAVVRASLQRRMRRKPGGPQAATRRRRGMRGIRAARSATPGRWSLAPQGDDPTARAVALAPLMIQRYGVVTRGTSGSERVSGGFSALYRVLSVMEERGDCLRCYAVEGLGGAQFSEAAIIDRLRDASSDRSPHRARPPSELVLAAADPAQPYGSLLPWPDGPAGSTPSHRPGRKAGALVVLLDGRPALYLERGGRSLLTWEADPVQVTRAGRLLDGYLRKVGHGAGIRQIDGLPALGHGLSESLQAGGATVTPSGLKLGGGPGARG